MKITVAETYLVAWRRSKDYRACQCALWLLLRQLKYHLRPQFSHLCQCLASQADTWEWIDFTNVRKLWNISHAHLICKSISLHNPSTTKKYTYCSISKVGSFHWFRKHHTLGDASRLCRHVKNHNLVQSRLLIYC